MENEKKLSLYINIYLTSIIICYAASFNNLNFEQILSGTFSIKALRRYQEYSYQTFAMTSNASSTLSANASLTTTTRYESDSSGDSLSFRHIPWRKPKYSTKPPRKTGGEGPHSK